MIRQRPLSNHSDADSGFISSEPAPDSEGSSTDRFESLEELIQVNLKFFDYLKLFLVWFAYF